MADSAESSDKTGRAVLPRRALITAAAGLPAAALAAAGYSGLPAETPATDGDGHQPVYRETEHIRLFYQRCRF